MLKIFLFGHIHVQIDGLPLKLTAPPKTIPLWAYLLLKRSTPIPRDTLAYTLWPDEPDTAARANLRRHLHQLQRMLPDAPLDRPWLNITPEIVQWNPNAAAWLDVAEFEHFSAAKETLDSAVRIYVSDLLEDIDDDWLFFERERLRNLFVTDLIQLLQRSREQGDYVQAIAHADRLLVHDPLREDVVRQVMALQYESGNRAGALAEYARFERLLRQKLHAEPMPETRAWYETILRNAPLPNGAPPGTAKSIEIQKPARLPFVGRESELSRLNDYWNRTVHQDGSVILISGENGIGKTRLTERIIHIAEASGGRALRGSTTFGEPLPYQAISEVLRSALPFLETMNIEPGFLSAIAPLVPELRIRRQDLPALVSAKRDIKQNRLFESLAYCLEALATPRPLLLILENMHWAGRASMLLLEYLARRAPGNAIMLLVTYREEVKSFRQPLQLMRRRLQRERLATHISLSPLSEGEIQEVIVQLLGAGTGKFELAHQLANRSQGNPLFLSEILRDWMASGKDNLKADYKHPSNPVSEFLEPHAEPIPGIQAIISGRLSRLTSPARAMAEIGAVIGSAFDLDLIREVAAWSEAQVIEALDELLDYHLIRETGTNSGYDFEFSHPMIRDTLYHEIPDSIRKHRHHRIAYLMRSLYAGRLDNLTVELALHHKAAGEFQSAAEYYLKTAKQASKLQDLDRALYMIQHALELDCEPRTQFNLLLLQDTILAKRGDQQKQEKYLAQLERLAFTFQEEDLICEILYRRIVFEHTKRDTWAETHTISLLKSHAFASGDIYWQAKALQTDAFLRLRQGKIKIATNELNQALEMYRSLNEQEEQALSYCGLAEAAINDSRLNDVPGILDQARSLSSHSNPSLIARILDVACSAALFGGNFPSALALGKRALEIYQSIQDRQGEADSLTSLAEISIWLDRPQNAQQYIDQAWLNYTMLGNRSGQARIRMVAAELAMNQGRFSESLQSFQDADTIFRELNDLHMQSRCANKLSELWLKQYLYSKARSAAQNALDLARQTEDRTLEAAALTNLARCVRKTGDFSQALKYLLASLNLQERVSQPPTRLLTISELAITYLNLNQLHEAQEATEAMLAEYTTSHTYTLESETYLWVAACVFRAINKHDQAREMLSQAHSLIHKRLSACVEVDTRAAYLQQSITRQVLAAYQNDEWPQELP